MLDEFIENNNLNKFITNEYIENEISLNQVIDGEEYINNKLIDASGRNYYQEPNEEEEGNQYNINENYQQQEEGDSNENGYNNQYYEQNENNDENNNFIRNQNQNRFGDYNNSRRNENSSERMANNDDHKRFLDMSKIDIEANSMKSNSKNDNSKAENYQNKSNLSNDDNATKNNPSINKSKISASEVSEKPEKNNESKKIIIDVINEISNNKITAANIFYENMSEKFIHPSLIKENQGLSYRNAAGFVDNPKNNNIKINLVEYSKEELELLEKLSNNKSIKIENDDYFRNAINELILKLERNALINKENKESGFNIHHHPLKKEIYLNEKEKFIYLEIINFKSIINQQVQEKKEKVFEINNLMDIIKTLNNQLFSKDEIIKNNMEISNKYNDLLKEFYNLQEQTKKLLNENSLLKNTVNEASNLNEVILKNYQNKLFDFGDFSNRLFSIYFDDNVDKN